MGFDAWLILLEKIHWLVFTISMFWYSRIFTARKECFKFGMTVMTSPFLFSTVSKFLTSKLFRLDANEKFHYFYLFFEFNFYWSHANPMLQKEDNGNLKFLCVSTVTEVKRKMVLCPPHSFIFSLILSPTFLSES